MKRYAEPVRMICAALRNPATMRDAAIAITAFSQVFHYVEFEIRADRGQALPMRGEVLAVFDDVRRAAECRDWPAILDAARWLASAEPSLLRLLEGTDAKGLPALS